MNTEPSNTIQTSTSGGNPRVVVLLSALCVLLVAACVVLSLLLAGPSIGTRTISMQAAVKSVQKLSELVVLRVNISAPTVAEGWISKTIIIAKGDVDFAVDLSKATVTPKAAGTKKAGDKPVYVCELPMPRIIRPRVRASDVQIVDSSSGLLRPLLMVYNDRDELVLKAMGTAEATIARMAATDTYVSLAKIQAEKVIGALLGETGAEVEFVWK